VAAYYNEVDPFLCEWLRNLIAAGAIAPGHVDSRSIEDVSPDDLRDFDQCHFFAGLGGWSYALRLAGWSDDYPIWTGSCPCQSFSAAGSRTGFEDTRDMWPAWFRLIAERRPNVIAGEQVTQAIQYGWLDRAARDLEGCGYAVGAAVLSSSAAHAWHKRERLWLVADTFGHEQPRHQPCSRTARRVGRQYESVSWAVDWRDALAGFRALDDGIPRSVAGCDAARNAITPQVAAGFLEAYSAARFN
jgi:DNA (cytosine-5)-methyltransferase 1